MNKLCVVPVKLETLYDSYVQRELHKYLRWEIFRITYDKEIQIKKMKFKSVSQINEAHHMWSSYKNKLH